jgi:ketosteroid isomerase-like protein
MALTLDDMIARQEIADVILRYARGIDRLDFDLVRSCYHPDAYDDHGSFTGDVDGFIAMCERFLPKWSATMHFMGNMLIEVDGDVARAETYAVAYHRRQEEDGTGKDDVFGIRYVDRFEKLDDEWKIAHRVVATEWRRVDPVVNATARGAVGVWGTRDGNDVIDWIMTAAPPA